MGANATIIQEKTIGKNSIVGAGAVVIYDVSAESFVVGVPARVIERHEMSEEDE